MFYDILERKNNFLGYKKKVQNVENLTFFQRSYIVYIIGPKLAIFRKFILWNIGQENVFYDILQRENNFLGNENKKFKNSKN